MKGSSMSKTSLLMKGFFVLPLAFVACIGANAARNPIVVIMATMSASEHQRYHRQ